MEEIRVFTSDSNAVSETRGRITGWGYLLESRHSVLDAGFLLLLGKAVAHCPYSGAKTCR